MDPASASQAAVKLTSWNEFRLIFGGFLPNSYLAYAVRGFFATGGKTCYVVRVGVASTPPTTALLPLPAAITSTQIANFAAVIPSPALGPASSVSSGRMQIRLDEPVSLAAGSVIAIGDPALNSQLAVSSVIDSQNVIVKSPAESPQPGAAVFALSGPAVATPVTSIVTASAMRCDPDSTGQRGRERNNTRLL